MRRYTAEKYEALYDQDAAELLKSGAGQVGQLLEHGEVLIYRSKRVKAGDTIEQMIYPVWVGPREATRAKKSRPTEAAQVLQNMKDSRRKLTWYMNANFATDDITLTLSYKGRQPATLDEARKDMQAYIRRVRRWRKAHGLPEMKYIYVIEAAGEDGSRARIHHHIVMSGMDREVAERIWEKGRCNSSRLQPDERGLAGLARYITKTSPRNLGRKKWCGSRNLKQPVITIADHKYSKRDVERMARDDSALRIHIQRKEPGYQIVETDVKYSDWVPGAYITVKLRRIQPHGQNPDGRRRRARGNST